MYTFKSNFNNLNNNEHMRSKTIFITHIKTIVNNNNSNKNNGKFILLLISILFIWCIFVIIYQIFSP